MRAVRLEPVEALPARRRAAFKLVKVGGATFVDYASADAYMASRPVAPIRAPRGAG